MREAPVIGIATQTIQPIPGKIPLAWVMGQRYVRAHTMVGAVPWIIPLLDDDLESLRAIFDRLDGVFLPGGVDVDPASYGECRLPVCGEGDQSRDAVELQLVRWARETGKPVFGVCRGIQMINVAFGGSLYQDLASQRDAALKHDYFPVQGYPDRGMLVHDVMVRPDTRLARILGSTSAPVNSLHHQGIKDLGAGLIASATAPDGVIEGVEGANGHFIVGVQWHPEELVESSSAMYRLFEAFVGAARDYRAGRAAG